MTGFSLGHPLLTKQSPSSPPRSPLQFKVFPRGRGCYQLRITVRCQNSCSSLIRGHAPKTVHFRRCSSCSSRITPVMKKAQGLPSALRTKRDLCWFGLVPSVTSQEGKPLPTAVNSYQDLLLPRGTRQLCAWPLGPLSLDRGRHRRHIKKSALSLLLKPLAAGDGISCPSDPESPLLVALWNPGAGFRNEAFCRVCKSSPARCSSQTSLRHFPH